MLTTPLGWNAANLGVTIVIEVIFFIVLVLIALGTGALAKFFLERMH
jgi:hypothetical protein